MKSILKASLTILMVCFAMTLVNCEKDDVELSSTINQEAKFAIKEYSFKSAKEKPKFNNSYFKVTQGIKKRIKEKGSYSERSTSDFTVDTTSVKEIEVDGITTYTMLITSEEQENNSFENLIIEIDSTEEVRAYLITYYPTSMNYVESHDSYSFQGEQYIERIDYDASFLNFNMLDTECTASLMCSWGGSDHAAGANCTASFIYTVIDCNDSGGGSSTGSGNNDPGDTTGDDFSDTPNNENSGATSGSSGPYTSTVSPKEEDYETQIINCLGDYILNGNTTIQPWLSNPGTSYVEIKRVATYLNNNAPNDFTCPSDEITDFAVEAIEALNSGGEVDFGENIIYTIDKPCQKQIVKDVINLSSDFTDLIRNTFENSEKVNVKFWNGDTASGSPGSTNPIYYGTADNFIINIKFDNGYLDSATDLSIVAVTLHELSHAYFMSLYLQGTLRSINSEYETLMNAFTAFYANPSSPTYDPLDTEIHNAMEDFIEQMANTIYNYAQINDIDVSLSFCRGLSWGTMHATELFDEVLDEVHQEQAQNIIITEQNNIEYGSAFPVKGTPCD